MKPTIGRIVIYYPSAVEREVFNNYQTTAPAVITAVWSDTCVNLKIIYDGIADRWKTSVPKVDEFSKAAPANEYHWDWPTKVE
jgi:hypothetical protein